MERREIPYAGTVSSQSAIEAFDDPGRQALVAQAGKWGDAFTPAQKTETYDVLVGGPTRVERLKLVASKFLENFGVRHISQ